MQVKSIKVTDYSTGKQYEYTDKTGSWQSIKAVDGKVNGRRQGGGTETPPSSTASTATSATSATPSQKNCGSSGMYEWLQSYTRVAMLLLFIPLIL